MVCLVLSSQALAVQDCCGVQWDLPNCSHDQPAMNQNVFLLCYSQKCSVKEEGTYSLGQAGKLHFSVLPAASQSF